MHPYNRQYGHALNKLKNYLGSETRHQESQSYFIRKECCLFSEKSDVVAIAVGVPRGKLTES